MRKFKTGGISTCFHCHKQLVRVKDGFLFAIVSDPDGRTDPTHWRPLPAAPLQQGE